MTDASATTDGFAKARQMGTTGAYLAATEPVCKCGLLEKRHDMDNQSNMMLFDSYGIEPHKFQPTESDD